MVRFDVMDGPPGASTVLLSSGLGGAAAYWAPQVAGLRARFRVITYDHAGTGRSPAALPEDYSIADMARDVLAVLDATDTASCQFVGHALGALVGLELALQAPGRLGSLTLVNGWAKADAHTQRCFDARMALLDGAGPGAYVRAQPIFLYPAPWLAANEAWAAAEDTHALANFQGAANLRARVRALRAFDASASLGRITVPTLVIASRDDVLVPATQSERLAAALPHATLAMHGVGGHAVNVTDPAAFEAFLLPFLRRHG